MTITPRDLFAAVALHQLLIDSPGDDDRDIALRAWNVADAMMATRDPHEEDEES